MGILLVLMMFVIHAQSLCLKGTIHENTYACYDENHNVDYSCIVYSCHADENHNRYNLFVLGVQFYTFFGVYI